MLGHCILVGSKQGNRGKTQALVDGNGPLQPVTPQLAMTGMGQEATLTGGRFLAIKLLITVSVRRAPLLPEPEGVCKIG